MITIHRSTKKGMETIEELAKGCWIEVTNPTADECQKLAEDLGFPKEFATDSLNEDRIPLIEKEDHALLVLVRVPCFRSKAASIPYVTLPMGIILTGNAVVTICRREHKLFDDIPHDQLADLSTAKQSRFVLHLLWSVANNYLRHVSDIDKIVEKLEDRLQRSLENREVLELLRYQKSLVHFDTALRANETMLERLQRSKFLELGTEDQDLLDDVFTEFRQVIGRTEISSNILSQMMDAFASIISNNLNAVMKFLTAITVILIVPTIIATFYGMNVGLPFEDHPSAFLWLTGLSILASVITGLTFWRKGWL